MLYRDPEVKLEDKIKIMEKETAGDLSDEIARFKLACEAGLPLAEKKDQLWKWYTNEAATESDKTFEASMSGFRQWQQLPIMQGYMDKFFDVILDVCKKRPTYYSKIFFAFLAPDIAAPEILKKYEELLAKLPPEIKARRDDIETAIEMQKKMLKSYELCRAYYQAHK
jgi:hypothetical protein